MQDGFGRTIDYLRIAITDRCNLRCKYCMPEEGVPWRDMKEILTYEEIETFCRMAGGKEEIWYASNIEIADYMNCAKMVHFTVEVSRAENMSGRDIWLSVDGKIVEVKSGAAVSL